MAMDSMKTQGRAQPSVIKFTRAEKLFFSCWGFLIAGCIAAIVTLESPIY